MHECQTAEEVREHYKAVRARTNQWKAPPQKIETTQPVAVPVRQTVVIQQEQEPAIHQQEQEPEPPIIHRHPSVHRLVGIVGAAFGESRIDIISARRTAKLSLARFVVMYLARKLTLRSYPEIGLYLGGRDHSTIIHGVQKITRLRKTDADLDAKIEALITQQLTQP